MRWIRALWRRILPPRHWRLPVAFALAVLLGLGLAILKISNALSYVSDDPKACVNCHIMAPQYRTWERGSHGRVATCNDCHLPHDNVVHKYFEKARDGGRHSFMFTFHLEAQSIRLREAGRKIVQNNCIRCHERQLDFTSLPLSTGSAVRHGEGKSCWECHRETPHGRVSSLSSTPQALPPAPSPALPSWLVPGSPDSILDPPTHDSTGEKK